MPPPARATRRVVVFAIYALAAGLAVWGGFGAVNYALAQGFYKNYLIPWGEAAKAYTRDYDDWPAFRDGGHTQYMEALVERMRRRGVVPPESNTRRSYVYRLRTMGLGEEDVFLFCLPDRIVLYGISRGTFNRIDRHIDGRADPGRGWFLGREAANGEYTGIWRL